jgi:hypothetical protein
VTLLVHICCGGCFDAALAGLREEFGPSLAVRGYFYNPNIHPLLEFRRRLKAVKVLNEALALPVEYEERYGLELFLQEIWQGGQAGRCRRCYRARLLAAARRAAELECEAFTSTLCVSGHQEHGEIRQAAAAAGAAWGVEFLYRDLRVWPARIPPRRGLYRQQYCGCVFSEEARYRETGRELYRGPGG